MPFVIGLIIIAFVIFAAKALFFTDADPVATPDEPPAAPTPPESPKADPTGSKPAASA